MAVQTREELTPRPRGGRDAARPPRGTEQTRLGPCEKRWSGEAAGLDAQGRDAPGVPVSQGAFVQGVMRSD